MPKIIEEYKYPILAVSIILATIIFSLSNREPESTTQFRPQGVASTESFVEEEPEFDPIVLRGTSTKLTKSFNLPDGGYKVTSKHTGGSSNFVVYLIDEYGEELDLVANEIGITNTSKAISVVEGKYRFNVEADGTWIVKIEAL